MENRLQILFSMLLLASSVLLRLCIMEIYGPSLPGERDALQPSLFMFMTSTFREVLLSKNSPELSIIQRRLVEPWGFSGPQSW
jgi:hypothetical protein